MSIISSAENAKAVLPHLELTDVSKGYGDVPVVQGVSLTIKHGERIGLLGPSGCGKTTTLNMIAGFLHPDSGKIRIAGQDVVGIPAHRRNTGIVFQSYALFLHMTVFQNVAFGLRMRGVTANEIRHRVEDALELVRLGGLGDRYPRQLSGGQQQRVALARALVIRPDILLLDEALSNLDAKLRQEMRVELVEILKRVGTTTVFVTHDQEEALALSDRIAIMNRGRIEQIGTPNEVYEEPATAFVAKFLGEANVLAGKIVGKDNDVMICDIGGHLVRSSRPTRLLSGERVEVIVRAERVGLTQQTSTNCNSFPARVEHVMHLGGSIRYILQLGGHRITSIERSYRGGELASSGDMRFVEWTEAEPFLAPLA